MTPGLIDQLPPTATLVSRHAELGPGELRSRVDACAERLRETGLECVALCADNGLDWVVTDLACQQAGVRLVPVPLFFSATQFAHALASGGAQALITDRRTHLPAVAASELEAGEPWLISMQLHRIEATGRTRVPAGTQKITFTSGTTGTPKGVCLSLEQQSKLSSSLANATGLDKPRHLCILPLSTLLENLAGVYAPLLAGGTVIVPPLADVGLEGSSGLQVDSLLAGIEAWQPHSLILVPEILRALTEAAERGWRPPSPLRFAAVGGGKVAPQLLLRARKAGLPVFEGYGLSECASVVCLNTPGADRPGSVGRPLAHVDVDIVDGEVVVRGSTFLGYVDQPESWGARDVHTGDLGTIDADGYLTIEGRAKNQIITGFGRNISPEWVESELLAGPVLRQAIVIGEARPYCSALLFPADPEADDQTIAAWLLQVNQRLPDYARVLDWARLPAALCVADGLLTENGRPRRASIEARYAPLVDELYSVPMEAGNQ